MALTSAVAWEVRTGGSDSNGGGYTVGAGGTDYSQQNAAQVVFNGSTITATYKTGSSFTVTGYTVAATDVGNIVNITGGTGFTPGRYEVTTVNTSVNTWSVNAICCTTGATGMTGRMGGGFLTIAQGIAAMTVSDQTIYVASGTYNITSALAPSVTAGNYQSSLIGYVTNHSTIPTGSNRPLISTGSNAINGITFSAATGWCLQNLIFSSTSGGVIGISVGSNGTQISNCKVTGFASGIVTTNTGYVYNTEVMGCTIVGISSNSGGNNCIMGCWVHDNTCVGISLGGTGAQNQVIDCLITNCTGASSDGIIYATNVGGATIVGNTIYGSGRDGIRLSATISIATNIIVNNIISNSSGYGINVMTAQDHPVSASINYNGYYSNTLGNTNNLNTGPNSIAMSASPFNNPGGNDFSLNSAAVGGLELKNAGFPSVMPGQTTPVGYPDIGVYRHQDVTSVTNILNVLSS